MAARVALATVLTVALCGTLAMSQAVRGHSHPETPATLHGSHAPPQDSTKQPTQPKQQHPADTAARLEALWQELRAETAAGDGDLANTTDCYVRLLAYEYAHQLQPQRAPHIEVFDALMLATMCNLTRPAEPAPKPHAPVFPLPSEAIYVDFVKGNDGNAGTEQSPVKTLQRAQALTRAGTAAPRCIVLRAGVHYMQAKLELTTADNDLVITNYPGEEVWLSGGQPIATDWKPYNVQPNVSNVYVTKIADDVPYFMGLMTLDPHERMIRARYPNAQPEDRFSVKNLGTNDGLLSYHAPPLLPMAEQVWVNTTGTYNFSIMEDYNGYGNGRCKEAGDPNCPCGVWQDVHHGEWTSYSYWASQYCAGGWAEMDRGNGYYNGPVIPLGLSYNTSSDSRFQQRAGRWRDARGGLVIAWRAQGWFVNMYRISEHDAKGGLLRWTKANGMPDGGWQGGRGWQINGTSGAIDPLPPFLVENIFEELDAPSEFYFDNATRQLFLYYNDSSSPPPADLQFVVPQLQEMIGVRGTQQAPVRNITIQGLNIRDAAATYMEPWGVPSGGDWALYRGGAVFIEGAEDIVVQQNNFVRVDGNGIFLSGYSRGVVLDNNSFAYMGDNAMAGWGYTQEHDGTAGEQPRKARLSNNYGHNVGVFQLQSSIWFQAKCAQITLEDNIMFNLPRAAVNYNDDFGGGNVARRNLIFNTCRHSGDHGPINSWRRQAYLSDVAYGPENPSYASALSDVYKNFIIANYGASQGFDNDDGSSYYNITQNFIEGEGLKQDYGGHDSYYVGNVNINTRKYDGQLCLNTAPFYPGHQHTFKDNICYICYTGQYGHLGACNSKNISASLCDTSKPDQMCVTNLSNNQYYTPYGNASIQCGDGYVPLADLQKGGIELGSFVKTLPSNDQVVAWGRQVLDMPQ